MSHKVLCPLERDRNTKSLWGLESWDRDFCHVQACLNRMMEVMFIYLHFFFIIRDMWISDINLNTEFYYFKARKGLRNNLISVLKAMYLNIVCDIWGLLPSLGPSVALKWNYGVCKNFGNNRELRRK